MERTAAERELALGRESLRHRARIARRDAYVGRVTSATKAIGLATVAAVGAVALYVSRAVPGHSTTSTSQASTGQASTSPTVGGTAGSAASGAAAPQSGAPSLTAPSSPPVRTTRPAPVITSVS